MQKTELILNNVFLFNFRARILNSDVPNGYQNILVYLLRLDHYKYLKTYGLLYIRYITFEFILTDRYNLPVYKLKI